MKTFFATTALLVAMPVAFAQEATPQTEPVPTLKTDDGSMDMATDLWIGQPVYDAQGDEIGTVNKTVLTEDGTEKIVVSVDRFLGFGEKQVALEKSQFTLRADGQGYDIAMTRAEIDQLEAYEPAEDASEPDSYENG